MVDLNTRLSNRTRHRERRRLSIVEGFVDSIASRFLLLATQPQGGHHHDEYLRPGIRTFPFGEYVTAYRIEGDNMLNLRVLRGNRDINAPLPRMVTRRSFQQSLGKVEGVGM
jgi:plasmid stabilization system protein ParE